MVDDAAARMYVDVASTSEVPTGSVRSFFVGGRTIAVYHTASGFSASDNSCPHRGGPLAEGDLMNGSIVCPWHLWAFDLETGCADIAPELKLTRHEVRVEGDRILIRLASEANPTP